MTTGVSGGLSRPYKGLVLAKRLKTVRGKVFLPEFGRDFFPKLGRENFLSFGRQNFS